MKRRKKREKKRTGEYALQILRASLFACILTTVLVIVLAFMVQWEWFSIHRIHAINTLIKAVSASLAGLLIGVQAGRRGWLLAGISGATYILLSYVAFSLIEGDFAVSWLFVSDLALGFTCAAITQVFTRVLKEMRAPD